MRICPGNLRDTQNIPTSANVFRILRRLFYLHFTGTTKIGTVVLNVDDGDNDRVNDVQLTSAPGSRELTLGQDPHPTQLDSDGSTSSRLRTTSIPPPCPPRSTSKSQTSLTNILHLSFILLRPSHLSRSMHQLCTASSQSREPLPPPCSRTRFHPSTSPLLERPILINEHWERQDDSVEIPSCYHPLEPTG